MCKTLTDIEQSFEYYHSESMSTENKYILALVKKEMNKRQECIDLLLDVLQ